MILEHFTELEADFLRFYGVDLPEALWGPAPVSARRFRVLLEALPRESALVRGFDPHNGAWGNTEELLAVLAEQVDAGNRLFFAAHAKKGTRPPKPLEIRRPGQVQQRRRQSSPAEVARFFGMRYTPEVQL